MDSKSALVTGKPPAPVPCDVRDGACTRRRARQTRVGTRARYSVRGNEMRQPGRTLRRALLKSSDCCEDWVTGEQATAGSQSTDPAWDEVGPQLPHMPHCAGCLRHTQADSNGHLAREEVRSPLQVRGLQLRGQVTRPRPRSGQTTEPGCELEF